MAYFTSPIITGLCRSTTLAGMLILLLIRCSEYREPQFVDDSGIQGGLAVYIGFKSARDVMALHAGDKFLVHGLSAKKKDVRKARRFIQEQKVYGDVSVEHWKGKILPYTDNLVNLLIVDKPQNIKEGEVKRVLAPNGVAYLRKEGQWEQYRKPWSSEIDEWTHYLHGSDNNAVSHDKQVAPPKHLQWVGNPLYCRSHELNSSVPAMVSAEGRLFYILDEGLLGIKDPRLPDNWSLIARDGFNGKTLWKRDIPNWGWRQWNQKQLQGEEWLEARGMRMRFPDELRRRLVAEGLHVYVTLGYHAPVSILDAATGKTIRTIPQTQGAAEILYSENTLILRVKNRYRKEQNPSAEIHSESVMAVDPANGDILWEMAGQKVRPLTLAAHNGRVYFGSSQKLKALDLSTGKQLWEQDVAVKDLVAYQDVLFIRFGGGYGFLPSRKLKAFDAATGKPLWTGAAARGENTFIADGLLYYGLPKQKYYTGNWLRTSKDTLTTMARALGYDPMTGKIRKRIQVKNLISPGHHYRCYPAKATDRYLMWPKRGVEFMDLQGKHHMRNNWVRGPCKMGLMPANGLLYAPPHQCFCYPSAMLNGFNALSANIKETSLNSGDTAGNVMEKGAAYGVAYEEDMAAGENEWPSFRRDNKRSGSIDDHLPVHFNKQWQKKLGGKLTQPVVVDERLYVAQINRHRIYCFDSKSGQLHWTYTAGGRIDSPPTHYQGRLLFGSHDGWVYCLDARQGEMIWRFRAAPSIRRIVAFNQLESPWPVHGSILVEDNVAYFAAGRSSFIDGGIYLYGLDPVTGEEQYRYRLEGPFPDLSESPGRPFDMKGALPDVLVSQNGFIYMKDIKFNKKLERIETPQITQLGDKHTGLHLFSTSASGLLDDSWWDRKFWMYSKRWPGFYMGLNAPKTGQILSFDDSCTYAFKMFTERNVHSPFSKPGRGYLLYADKNDTEPILVGEDGTPEPVKWLPQVKKRWADSESWIGLEYCDPAVNFEKGPGFSRPEPPLWKRWIPLRVRAMVLAENALYISGPPDIIDPDNPLAAYKGEKGMHLWVLSRESGEKISGYKLASMPVYDGMTAAYGNLYLSMVDGRILCLGE